jgi:hypothetical protein
MTEQEKQFFAALTADRAESADTLEKPSMRGIKNSVVEKYSDQAHFIYELLQNADDAGATNAHFILEPDRLIFIHNGTRHFSVTDPSHEDEDSAAGRLGDINSITSIANSNKTAASIGKFGVGFKAVFQYTSTPYIYDPNVHFRIDRFIVPTFIEEDFEGRRANETLFVFPFDHAERGQKEAYSDIAEKLRSLSYPLLFLSSLRDIDFEFEDVIGLYGKSIPETRQIGESTAELITLTQNSGEDIVDQYLWLFTRKDEAGRKYSVGFFLDKDKKLLPKKEPAFCFFPTKENTGLNFLIHAPFLLTDSREGIRAGVAHNNHMVALLAKLASDSLLYLRDIGIEKSARLIDDSILSIIPTDGDSFTDVNDKRHISFMPFFTEIKNVFTTESILPTRYGYCAKDTACWAAVPQLAELFTDEQLADICEIPEAHWVFVSMGRDEIQRGNKALASYIDEITNTWLDENVIISGRTVWDSSYRKRTKSIKGISAGFIEKQPITWLHVFYKWLSETTKRTDSIKKMPVFLDQNKKAVSALDSSEHLILFFPDKDLSGYTTVYSELLTDKGTVAFLEKIGVKKPSIRNQIYNIILPQYKSGVEIDTDPHFLLFFKYYKQCPQEEVDDFIELIKDCDFVTYYEPDDSQPYRGKASDLYFPSPELKEYFETKKDALFVAYDEYLDLVGTSNEKQLVSFLTELGIKKSISIVTRTIDYSEAVQRGLPMPRSTRGHSWSEKTIDGCKELVMAITESKSIEKSKLLWSALVGICETYHSLSYLLIGSCSYYYYSGYTQSFEAADVVLLRTEKWLVNAAGDFVSTSEITRDEIASIYDTSSEGASSLFNFLQIANEAGADDDDDDYDNLTDKQKERIELAKKAEALGLTEDDLEEIAFIKKQREAANAARQQKGPQAPTGTVSNDDSDSEDDIGEEEDFGEDAGSGNEGYNRKPSSKVIRDIARRTKPQPTRNDIVQPEPEDRADEEIDEDEYTPRPVDYSKRIEQAKQKSAIEIDKIAYFEGLQKRAVNAEKYSFCWFNTLLEMETLTSNANNLNSKEVSISFARVERESGTQRTLVLKYPSRYIPQFMEDLADIPLVLHFGDQTKTVAIEVANVKSYTLRVKLKTNADIDGIDLSAVTEARIDAKSPVFLLEELRKQFAALGYDDDYNMQQNLCENIEFVFGPPGTGKTTHLVRNILIPMMQQQEDLKVLVLTPTNKSADVLVSRLMDTMGSDTSYIDWLVRFGITNDEAIEASEVFRDKTFDIRKLKRTITVTTIARFPYDFFMPNGARIFLNAINWDYIVVDEASMIPIANIVYPLYKKTPRKFYIAGDPFQIEPITAIDLWKNENIYTMVQLDSFVDPVTVPYKYPVTLLTTQYRSIPAIGSVFSKFAYGGILKHNRTADSAKLLNVDCGLNISALNIVKFPVTKYESITRSKRLQHSSSYHIYSALFSFEFTSFLAENIARANEGTQRNFTIGIIAPYRAQADLIDKLMASASLPVSVSVQVGTIHGFQGDECDIIIAVFNAPPSISSSKEMFLNKKNIINVSISRARDYLFIIMPDDETENVENLRLVKRVERLAKDEYATEWHSHDLEKLIFGTSDYLEENTFSTGHQSVNVYGLPEKTYEIRSEDTAVDVQVHRNITVQIPQSNLPLDDKNKSLPVSVETQPARNTKKRGDVVSKQYGDGYVVKRAINSGKTYVTIQFGNIQKTYDEDVARKNRELTFF